MSEHIKASPVLTEVEHAMRDNGCTEEQIKAVLVRVGRLPRSPLRLQVDQQIGTVEAGSTVVGYRANRIG